MVPDCDSSWLFTFCRARSAVGSATDSRARGPGSIPGPATYFPSPSAHSRRAVVIALAKVYARGTGQPLRRSKPDR